MEVLPAGVSAEPAWHLERLSYGRILTPDEFEVWLDPKGDYGGQLREALGTDAAASLKTLLEGLSGRLDWPLFVSLGRL